MLNMKSNFNSFLFCSLQFIQPDYNPLRKWQSRTFGVIKAFTECLWYLRTLYQITAYKTKFNSIEWSKEACVDDRLDQTQYCKNRFQNVFELAVNLSAKQSQDQNCYDESGVLGPWPLLDRDFLVGDLSHFWFVSFQMAWYCWPQGCQNYMMEACRFSFEVHFFACKQIQATIFLCFPNMKSFQPGRKR